MRETRTAQSSIFQTQTDHEIARELKRISDWLDQHAELLDAVAEDVRSLGSYGGRRGMSIDSILRCAILKQYRQVDYRTLAFYLRDSVSFIEFARLDRYRVPSKSSLQRLISAIRPDTWAVLGRCLLTHANACGVEPGDVIRIDSTATDTAILEPSDSGLLDDAVRTMVRLLKRAHREFGYSAFRNHRRVAKRRRHAIFNARTNARRRPLYEDLLQVTSDTLGYLDDAYKVLKKQSDAQAWRDEVDHYRPLIENVIEQTQRRVIDGERVPAEDKVVSLFEPHTDIIVKGQRDVQYGHKLTLSSGASGLVLDVFVEHGNPADSACFLPALQRHVDSYGQPPHDVAADGGYASAANLDAAKTLGVEHVAFHKRVGLTIEAMTGDRWLYNKLRNFRAGIEAIISYLKRCFGLSRCNWKGLEHFKAYVHSAVFTHNLVVLTQRLAAPG